MGKVLDLSRTSQLKFYLKRLGAGEDLESVRADFVKAFKEVDAVEIMKAEQELLKEGTPITELQKLCDVHSALFHGATREERIAKADEAVRISMGQSAKYPKADYSNKKERAAAVVELPGHPLHTFTRENADLAKLLADAKQAIADAKQKSTDERYSINKDSEINRFLDQMRELSIHYAKKGDLLYPHLKTKYGISGPSDVMWTVDDEIRDEIAGLAKRQVRDEEWLADFDAVLTRADEMIYKEANILFPNCAVNFTDEEWMDIYQDAKDYAVCFGIISDVWEEAEKHVAACNKEAVKKVVSNSEEIVMPGGHMTVEQLTALLNTIPLEITFVDADDINRFFNEGPKVFKRPGMAIDREVYSCHPPKIEPMVRSIIEDFKAGTRDRVPVWMDKGGRTMLVTYMAVRDKQNKYLGTVELIQDMEFAKEHFLK